METTSHVNGPDSLSTNEEIFAYQDGYKDAIKHAVTIAKGFIGRAKSERLKNGVTLGVMEREIAQEIVAEERGGDISAKEIRNALEANLALITLPEKFCSHPGCGYPDGKPCHGCGRVVPMGDATRLEWAMKRCHRAAKTLSEFATLVNENQTRKRMIQTLAEAINIHSRDEIDRLMDMEEWESNPGLMPQDKPPEH